MHLREHLLGRHFMDQCSFIGGLMGTFCNFIKSKCAPLPSSSLHLIVQCFIRYMANVWTNADSPMPRTLKCHEIQTCSIGMFFSVLREEKKFPLVCKFTLSQKMLNHQEGLHATIQFLVLLRRLKNVLSVKFLCFYLCHFSFLFSIRDVLISGKL